MGLRRCRLRRGPGRPAGAGAIGAARRSRHTESTTPEPPDPRPLLRSGILDPMNVEGLLQSIPPLLVYLTVGGVVGAESLGIPLPGEIVLVTAAMMSAHHGLDINPVAVGGAAALGAVIGDTVGYTIGRRFGMSLFDRLGRRFPAHFGPGHVALAERLFARWGPRAVFFGRFIALLRIFAGPLAGALKMQYRRFLLANVAGALFWAGGTTALIYFTGRAAEVWLARSSWVALVIAVICGGIAAMVLRERTSRAIAELETEGHAPADPGTD